MALIVAFLALIVALWRSESRPGRVLVAPLAHMVASGSVDPLIFSAKFSFLDRSGASFLEFHVLASQLRARLFGHFRCFSSRGSVNSEWVSLHILAGPV